MNIIRPKIVRHSRKNLVTRERVSNIFRAMNRVAQYINYLSGFARYLLKHIDPTIRRVDIVSALQQELV